MQMLRSQMDLVGLRRALHGNRLARGPTLHEVALGVAVSATFVFGFAVSPAYYIPMSVFSVEFGRSRSGVLIGLIDACGYGMTMLFAPLAGSLLEAQGWPPFLAMLVGVSLLSLVFLTAFLVAEGRAKHQPGT